MEKEGGKEEGVGGGVNPELYVVLYSYSITSLFIFSTSLTQR